MTVNKACWAQGRSTLRVLKSKANSQPWLLRLLIKIHLQLWSLNPAIWLRRTTYLYAWRIHCEWDPTKVNPLSGTNHGSLWFTFNRYLCNTGQTLNAMQGNDREHVFPCFVSKYTVLSTAPSHHPHFEPPCRPQLFLRGKKSPIVSFCIWTNGFVNSLNWR